MSGYIPGMKPGAGGQLKAPAITGTEGQALVYSATTNELEAADVGDMATATYDPTAVGGDAFDMANMVEATDAKVMTAAERTKIGYIAITQAVDLDAIETRVNQLDAAVVLKGSWDASGGSFPGSGTAQAGDSYIVSVGGTVDSVEFTANDRIVALTDNASTTTYAANWLKLDYTDAVLSVAGRTGAVTLSTGDVSGLSTVATTGAYSDLSGKPTLGTASSAALIDDDTLATATSANVASAESVKAYVDTTVAGVSGDVVGPASATDSRIATFDGTTGKLLKDGGSTIANIANATHTGDVTGATALTIASTAISGKTEVTIAETDSLLVERSGALYRALVSGILRGAPDAILLEQFSTGTSAGSTSSNTLYTRQLNTEQRDPDGIVGLSSYQFTPTVDCWCEFWTVAYATTAFTARLYCVTDSALVGQGYTGHSYLYSHAKSEGGCAVEAGKTYQLEIYVTSGDANGKGYRAAISGLYEQYAGVKLWKL